ncbi:hypothetical protein DV735_g5880, partial [Chaetothyriales sp. CBS 134920]
VKQVLASGSSAFIGEVDDSTVLKYPLAPGEDMTRLDVERKLLEIIGPHERIIRLKSFSNTGLYLERAVNGTVADYILESGKPLPSVKQRLSWCREAAEAVAWIHNLRILHCDIQPTNLLLDEGLHIKLSDFQGRQLSENGEVLLDGWSAEPCRFYCPRDDAFDADVKTDLFALGCTIYFLIMGHAVFPDIVDGEEGWYDKVSDRFASQQFPTDQHICSTVTSKCWNKEYESAEELVRDLEALVRDLEAAAATALFMPTIETAVPSPDSAPATSETNPHRAFPRDSSLDSSASRWDSDPSDFDWISPFTLPPLPALRRARDHDAVKSPERVVRQRDDSGAYYAAAWGSPYASPSPSRPSSASHGTTAHRSDRTGPNRPTPRRRLRHSVDIGEAVSPDARGKLRGRNRLLKLLNKFERPNWLSDSESSGEEHGVGDLERTPKSRRRVADWSTLSLQRRREEAQPVLHYTSDSLDTVTPDTFRGLPRPNRQGSGSGSRAQQDPLEAMSGTDAEAVAATAVGTLQTGSLPRRTSLPDSSSAQSPQSPSRPRQASIQSVQQRPKKKVTWNGRSLVIALPMTDRESSGLPPVMTAQELREKLDGLIAQGWQVSGFDLAPSDPEQRGSISSQSRPDFPPVSEIDSERKLRHFGVCIPNQQEWDDWIRYLQEEKLRALGVSPSSSEAAPSVVSPLSQSLSRPSSKYTGSVQSPQIGHSSEHFRARSIAFSPGFGASPLLASQGGRAASAKYSAFHAPVHGYKHSFAFGSGRRHSPLDHGSMQPAGFAQPRRSPGDVFLPIGPQGIRSLDEVVPPAMGKYAQQSALPPNARSDQYRPIPESLPFHNLPQTPTEERVASKTPIEIQHPTPRSHRHNLSAALQKEIDEAEAALAKQPPQHSPILEREALAAEEEAHHELPILKRPELVDDEKSDIVTNPSVAHSPLADRDQSPASNWQALSNAALGSLPPSSTGHKSQPSLAGLNVQATEFDPKAGFQSSNFDFSGRSFQAMTQPVQAPSLQVRKTRGPAPRQVSVSRFNVEAPSFVPRSVSAAVPDSSKFTFSSSFNVDAPEFHPDKSRLSNDDGQDDPTSDSGQPTSIFGTVQIDPNSKVQRRAVKGSHDGHDPAFTPGSPAAELVDKSETDDRSGALPDKTIIEGWSYVPADESEITHEKTPQSPLPLHSPKLVEKPVEIQSPLEQPAKSPTSGETVVVYEELSEELSDLPSSPIPFSHQQPSNTHHTPLTALDNPFAVKQGQIVQSPSTSQTRAVSGILASRWAVPEEIPTSPPSPTPPRSAAGPSLPLSSADPFTKDETDEEILKKSVKVTVDPSDSSEDEQLSPAHQRDQVPSPATAARPHVATVADDDEENDDAQPSFEEIDAVMKQFEDNPELGIEREESPLNPAALLDLQFAPTLRSGARSLSPRRNFPQVLSSDTASAPPYGLGIGVRRLNSGKEQVSEWDDDLSTTDEAKVQSRAQFFDRHVQNLVDGALENRLVPVEQTLRTIQHSISLLVTKPRAQSHENLSPPADADLATIMAELAELRKLVERPASAVKDGEDAPSHPALDEREEDELRFRADGLETMVERERERADYESLQRQKADEEIELLKLALDNANARAADYETSSKQAAQRLDAFIKEKEAYKQLEHTVDGLEKMIEEHGKLKEELECALEEEKQKNKQLSHTLLLAKDQLTDRVQRCQSLHSKVDRLQEQIAAVVSSLAVEQSESQIRENELKTRLSMTEGALSQAKRHAEKVQLDMDDLERRYKEALTFKDRFESLQAEHAQAQGLIGQLRNERRESEDKAYRLERQVNESQSVRDSMAATTIARLTAELEASKTQSESYRAEAESQIGRLQSKLDQADQDFEDQKVKHDTVLAEMHDAHNNAIRVLDEKHQHAVEELHAAHERKLADLRDRHTRAMHNSSDDRHRIEYQFNEKLSLAEDKIKHLEGKVSDLTDRLEITKSAARAAVEAATAKAAPLDALPTPANSVIASPPTRAASGSLTVVKGEPEKISVQSLRESILVLQEQLQNREQKIELLVAEIKTLDPDGPSKLKECEAEIQWLRELLAVRMDEIQELIATLSLPSFDRSAVKDAAIRLKANIEMEQSIREKSTTGQSLVPAVPTLSQIAAYAQSPRQTLPLVANAAWGNLRRAKQYAGDAYESYVSQTPSRSSSLNSQASFHSGVITPPGSAAPKTQSNAAGARKSLTQPRLSTGPEPVPRPLRGYSTQPRTLGKKANSEGPTWNTSALSSTRSPSPQTPGRVLDLGEDVDDDARSL